MIDEIVNAAAAVDDSTLGNPSTVKPISERAIDDIHKSPARVPCGTTDVSSSQLFDRDEEPQQQVQTSLLFQEAYKQNMTRMSGNIDNDGGDSGDSKEKLLILRESQFGKSKMSLKKMNTYLRQPTLDNSYTQKLTSEGPSYTLNQFPSSANFKEPTLDIAERHSIDDSRLIDHIQKCLAQFSSRSTGLSSTQRLDQNEPWQKLFMFQEAYKQNMASRTLAILTMLGVIWGKENL